MKIRKFLSTLLALALTAGLFAVAPITANAANINVTSLTSDSVASLQSRIQTAISSSGVGDTVTVTGASFDQVGSTMYLNIKAGVTVIWRIGYGCPINLDNLIELTGDGTFEVGAGGHLEIHDEGTVITGGNGINVIVRGGTVRAGGSSAIDAFYVEVRSGTVRAAGNYYTITARI